MRAGPLLSLRTLQEEDERNMEAGGPVVLYVRGAGEDRADPCAGGVDGIRISGVVS